MPNKNTPETTPAAVKDQCLLVIAPDGDPCLIPLSKRTASLLKMAMLADQADFTAAGLVIPGNSEFGTAIKAALTYLENLPADTEAPTKQ